ncbi:MAG: LamG-like jellyroll fold domain-containing protein [Phormidesmis sp.]
MATLIVSNTLDNWYGTKAKEGSLRAAVETAKAGDVIRFDPSLAKQTIQLERRYEIDKDIVIDGSDAPGLTLSGGKKTIILETRGDGRVFEMRNLTLVDGFHAKYNASALRVMGSNAKITVKNSEFRDNVAGIGGAIWARDNADVTILNSKFSGNRSTEWDHPSAGAVVVFTKSKLTIKGSEFINNKGVSGGAVTAIFTELTVEDSFFKGNQSTRWGGAVHVDGASVPAQERYYSGKEPRDTVGGNVAISNSRFEDNRSAGFGGAVSIWGYDQDFVTIDKNDFINNQVTLRGSNAKGGALWVSGKLVTIRDTNFIGNSSDLEGGGVYHEGESRAVFEGVTFSGNKAKQGGGIFSSQWNGPGTGLNDTRFENNQADEGGAIYKYWGKPFDITNSAFVNNSSQFAGNNNKLTVDGALIKAQPNGSFVLDSRSYEAVSDPSPQSPGNNTTILPMAEPIAKLSFDQMIADKAADTSTNGKNNAGWLYGKITSTNGKAGKAVAFNGGDVIQIKNSQDINLGIHPERTISLWFQVNDASAVGKQVLYEEGGQSHGLNIYVEDDLLYFGGWNTPKSGWKGSWISTDKITSGKWHHAALVLDGEKTLQSTALTAYVDGKRVGQMEGTQLWEHSNGIGIGNVSGGTKFHDGIGTNRGHGLVGAIDELAIFNSALSDGQLQQLSSSF